MTELIEPPIVEPTEPPLIVEAPGVAAAVLESAQADGDRVTLLFKLTAPTREPLAMIRDELQSRLDGWRESSPEWQAVLRSQELLAAAQQQLVAAAAAVERTRSAWKIAIATGDPSESEQAYRQARVAHEVVGERHVALSELAQERRLAAEKAWQKARVVALADVTQRIESLAASARAAVAEAFGDGATIAAFAETIGVATALRLRGAQINNMASKL